MEKYSSPEIIEILKQKLVNGKMPSCRFCGGAQYTAIPTFTSLLQQSQTSTLDLGPSVPAATIICNKCGHVELFALGVLGVLQPKGDESDGPKK